MTFIFELHSATHWVQATEICCVKMCDRVIDFLSSTTNLTPTSVLFEGEKKVHTYRFNVN